MTNPKTLYRATSYIAVLLIAAATSFTEEYAEADEAEHKVTIEKEHSIPTAIVSSIAGLPKLYESVSHSIVRVETTASLNVTGVIVSPQGHILVGTAGLDDKDIRVHTSDGRILTAKSRGWSTEWRLTVIKINEVGPWPAIKLGSTKNLKAGEPCLVIGYSPRGDTKFDVLPTARLGFIDRNVPTSWFTTTCFPGFYEAAVVIGMNGQLLGVGNSTMGTQSYQTAIDLLIANRNDLFAGKNLDWVRFPPSPDSVYRIAAGDHPEMLGPRNMDDVLGKAESPARLTDSQLADVKQIAKKSAVRLVSKDQLSYDGEHYNRWSGVIVSEDGYILTCAHSGQLPGEQITVRLSDGRDADAIALGTNPITDIGLVKITTPGSWPYAKIEESATLRPGDPLVVAGYPAHDAKGEWTSERTPGIIEKTVRQTQYMVWTSEVSHANVMHHLGGGASGGGVFNRDGRYVGTISGSSHVRYIVARAQWNDLKQFDSIDTATGMPHPLRKQFVAPGRAVAQSVVKLLVDSKSVGIGTIVDADGWILAKASVLDGKVNCQLPDGSIVSSENRAESQEHDLALLKIDAGNLIGAEIPTLDPPSIAQALCAVISGKILKPGIVSTETRAIPPEPRWKGDATEDTPNGPMISRLAHGWQNKTNLSTNGTKLQLNDIIVSINGHPTPDAAKLAQVLETGLTEYCTGDLVSVELRRKGSRTRVLTPLPRATVPDYWMMQEHDSPRRSGFAAVFDTDIELLIEEVGCPLIDVEGHICGIAIASRGRNETQRGPSSILPNRIVSRVIERLVAEANSK